MVVKYQLGAYLQRSHINPKPSAGQPGIAFKHEGDRFHHYEPGVFMRQRRWQAGVFFPATLCFLIAWVLTADAADPSKEPIPQPRKACELYETVTRTGLSPSSISWMRRWRCSGPEPTIFMRSTTYRVAMARLQLAAGTVDETFPPYWLP